MSIQELEEQNFYPEDDPRNGLTDSLEDQERDALHELYELDRARIFAQNLERDRRYLESCRRYAK